MLRIGKLSWYAAAIVALLLLSGPKPTTAETMSNLGDCEVETTDAKMTGLLDNAITSILDSENDKQYPLVDHRSGPFQPGCRLVIFGSNPPTVTEVGTIQGVLRGQPNKGGRRRRRGGGNDAVSPRPLKKPCRRSRSMP